MPIKPHKIRPGRDSGPFPYPLPPHPTPVPNPNLCSRISYTAHKLKSLISNSLWLQTAEGYAVIVRFNRYTFFNVSINAALTLIFLKSPFSAIKELRFIKYFFAHENDLTLFPISYG